jgi:hypothetical protein
MSAFERKVLRIFFLRIKVNKNPRKQYDKAFVQLFGNLDPLLFVRTSRLIEWIVKEKKSGM